VESQISRDLAYQIRSMRERESLSQTDLAKKLDTSQNAVYRLESPGYGKASISTLKKVAEAFDVALVVRFVPFGELVDWVAGVPHTVVGLSVPESLCPESYESEEASRNRVPAARGNVISIDQHQQRRPSQSASGALSLVGIGLGRAQDHGDTQNPRSALDMAL
jgi:transcriptional regulator with XRE-family HTH domain